MSREIVLSKNELSRECFHSVSFSEFGKLKLVAKKDYGFENIQQRSMNTPWMRPKSAVTTPQTPGALNEKESTS